MSGIQTAKSHDSLPDEYQAFWTTNQQAFIPLDNRIIQQPHTNWPLEYPLFRWLLYSVDIHDKERL